MEKQHAVIPNSRTSAYDQFNNAIEKIFSDDVYYNIDTKVKYKIIRISTRLYGDDNCIEIQNLDTKKLEAIKNHELKNLELLTKENHP